MEPGIAAEWSDLFVAAAGASAALAGLVFVAVSINIDRILGNKGLPELSLVTLMLLVGVLVVSLFCLVPGQGSTRLGIELLVVTLLWAAVVSRFAVRSLPPGAALYQYPSRLGLPLTGSATYLVGSMVLISGNGSGLDWVFAGLIAAIIAAMMNAWILLVEILR